LREVRVSSSGERWDRARGAFLVEALIAVVVFSIAIAGTFGLLANALRTTSNALARAQAQSLAASTLAHMWAEDFATLADRYDAHAPGAGFRTLVDAATRLPGVTPSANVPRVTFAPGPSSNSRRASVTVFWQLPSESAPHQASMTGVVAPR